MTVLGVLLLLGMAGSVASTGAAAQTGSCWTTPPTYPQGFPQWSTPPQMVIDPAGSYTATIETNRGTIEVDLLADQAPATVNNFVCLATAGYYDVTVFHRIIQGFMIQGGDPTGTGTAGPGYQFADELPTGQSPYTRGTLAMANAGPGTNGSQFFIVQQDQPATFPNNYSIFGRVTTGMDVVDGIAAAPVVDNGRGEVSSPMATIGIKSITITDGEGNVLAADTAMSATPGASPVAGVATTAPVSTPTTAAEQTATPAAGATTEDDDDGNSNMGLWIAGGVAILAGAGYWFWSQSRKPKGKPAAKARPTAKSTSTAATTVADEVPGESPATTTGTQATRRTTNPRNSRRKGNRKR